MYCHVCDKTFLKVPGTNEAACERFHAHAHASEEFPSLFIEYQNLGETIDKVVGDNMARCFRK